MSQIIPLLIQRHDLTSLSNPHSTFIITFYALPPLSTYNRISHQVTPLRPAAVHDHPHGILLAVASVVRVLFHIMKEEGKKGRKMDV